MLRESLIGVIMDLDLDGGDEGSDRPDPPAEWLVKEFLGEGAGGIVYSMVPLADPDSKEEAFKFATGLPMFEMETLHHSMRVDEEMYPDHPLRMSAEARFAMLTGEMLKKIDNPRLTFRISFYNELRPRVVNALVQLCGPAAERAEPLGPVLAESPLRSWLDENLLFYVGDVLDDDLIIDERRPLIEKIASGLRLVLSQWHKEHRLTSLSTNPLANLLGLYAEDYISREELDQIGRTADFAARVRPVHADGLLDLVAFVHAHLTQPVSDDGRRRPISGPEVLGLGGLACLLAARVGSKDQAMRAAQWAHQLDLIRDQVNSAQAEHDQLAEERSATKDDLRIPPGARPTARPIFGPGDRLQLSETMLDPEWCYWASAGYTLAGVHGAGVLHGDLHGGNLLFDSLTGTTSMIDFGAGRLVEPADPELMATDIIHVSSSIPRPALLALISGYVKTSRMIIDPEIPGFTDNLLEALGGTVLSQPRPAVPVLSAEQCDQLLGPVIARTATGLAVTAPPAGKAGGPVASGPAALAACGLLMAGLDLRSALPESGPAAGLVASPYVREMLRRICRRDDAGRCDAHGRPAPDRGGLAADVSPAVLRFLGQLAERPELAAAGGPGPAQPRHSLLGLITESGAADQDTLELLAAITDVADWLAAWADAGPPGSEDAFTTSLELAQLSVIALQRQEWPTLERELRELTVTDRHRRLSWYPRMFAAQPADKRYQQYFTYGQSRIILYSHMFDAEVPGTGNRPWSANWRAFDWASRDVTGLLRHAHAGGPDQRADETLQELTRLRARQLAAIVQANSLAAVSDFGLNQLLANRGNELKTLGILIEIAANASDSPGPPNADIARLLDFLEDRNTFDFDRRVALALRLPNDLWS